MIADEAANQLLQCGIDYYNKSQRPAAPYEALEMMKHACSIAVGERVRQRCKENTDIVQRAVNKMPPRQVASEVLAIRREMKAYCELPDMISNAVMLLKNCKPHLEAIKSKLGADNAYYRHLATEVVKNAMYDVVAEVNGAMKSGKSRAEVRSIISKAYDAVMEMGRFNIDDEYRQGQYAENRKAVVQLLIEYGPVRNNATEKQNGDDSGSGVIKGIVSILLFCLFCWLGSMLFDTCRGCSDSRDDVEEEYSDDDDETEEDSEDTSAATADVSAAATSRPSTPAPAPKPVTYTISRPRTGSHPYVAYYGHGIGGDNYIEFKCDGASSDVVAIVKRVSSGRVVGHVYVRAGGEARVYVPDGRFQAFFYFGDDWAADKPNGKVVGAFTKDGHVQKDEPIRLNNQYMEYTLYPTPGGNLNVQDANPSEIF